MATIGYATLQVIPSMKGVQGMLTKELAGADADADAAGKRAGGKFTSGVGSALKKGAGLFAGFFAVEKVAGFLGGTISEASDLVETMNKASVIFGKSMKGIDSFGNTAAKSLGLSKEAAVAFAANFGDMFSQLGFSQKAAADMSKATVKMSADLGSFNNLPTGDVADRISAAFRGEYDSLQALIPNINAARVEQEAMAATGKTAASALTAQEKAAAVLAIVNKDGARAQGDFARTSGGLANQQKILSAQTKDLQAKMGAALVPALAKVSTVINGKLFPALGVVGGALVDLGGFVKDNIGTIKIIAGVITTLLLPQIIRWGIQSTIAAAKSVAAWITSRAASVSSILWQSAGLVLIGAGWISVGVAAAINAAKIAAAWVLSKLGVAGTIVLYGIAFAMMFAGWVASGLAATAGALAIAAAWLIAIAPIALVIAAIVGIVVLIVKNWDTIKAATAAVWGAISSAVSNAVSFVVNFVKANWPLLLAIITGPIGLAVLFIVKNFDKIKAFMQAVWTAVSGAASTAWTNVKNTVINGAQGIVDGVRAIPGKLKDLGGKFKEAGTSLVGKLIDGIGSAAGFVGDFAGKIWEAVKNAINSGIRKLNGLLEFKIKIPGAPDVSVNPPDIPQLAKGGVVNRATLAVVGEGTEPEAIMPLSKLAALLESGVGRKGTDAPSNDFTVYQQPGESTDELAERLWFKQRARG